MAFSATTRHDEDLGCEVVVLSSDGDGNAPPLVAEIVPDLGSNLARLRSGPVELIQCDRSLLRQRRWTGTPVLWPLPNRVSDKRYRFGGRAVDLARVVRPEGNWPLIHGLVDDLPWRAERPLAGATSASVRTSVDLDGSSERHDLFPFPSRLTLTFTVETSALRIGYRVDNLGHTDVPFAFALHPYFPLLDGERSEVVVPADGVMEADDELLPTGRVLPMGAGGFDLRRPTAATSVELDHVFTDLRPGVPCELRHPETGVTLELAGTDDFTHVVLYTLKSRTHGFVCLENQTGSTDAINLHTRAVETGDDALMRAAHLLVVPPGEAHEGEVRYGVRWSGPPGAA